MSRGNQREIDR